MTTQNITLENQIQVQPISYPAKTDIAIKVILYAAILTCINLVAFL